MLDDKLSDLKLRSRLKIMELDRERIRVRNELRNSRKKNITINEAISSGLIPADDSVFGPPEYQTRGNTSSQFSFSREPSSMHFNPTSNRSASSPPRRRDGMGQQPTFSRSMSTVQSTSRRRLTSANQFSKQPTIPERDEYDVDRSSRRSSIDTVGAYVIDEFEKMSQVVPNILRALAKKKAEILEEEEKATMIAFNTGRDPDVKLLDYEPDMNKVRKTVSSVKKLRHRMSISKRLETSKPQKSLNQMIKERTDNIGEYDEYTDGTCALMKRRLEKKRRDSAPVIMEADMFHRKQSFPGASGESSSMRRASVHPGPASPSRRSSSMSSLPTMPSRSSTSLGFGSHQRHNNAGFESDIGTQIMDEDELINKQRIMRELEKYDMLQNRVDDFLLSRKGFVREDIIPIT